MIVGQRDLPLVKDAIAHIECRVAEAVTGETHTMFLAEVQNAAAIEGGAPLTYFRGKFGRFETELEEAAYRDLRHMVLDRRLPIGSPLDVDQHRELLDAYRARDVEGAKRLIHKHNNGAKEVAREVIEAPGGEL